MIREQQPKPQSQAVSQRMQRVRRENTSPEVALRSQLHRLGLRFRVHIRATPKSLAKPDIVFTRSRIAVFVDGCFWHACPEHASWPKTNRVWWRKKILANVHRDRQHDAELTEAGWTVVRVWEHENPEVAAATILSIVRQRDRVE